MKKTKIVSTLGPASSDIETITKLIEAGADVFRFNFSHGTHEEHLQRLKNVHLAEKKTHKTVGIMLDTKGAEIRTTVQKNGDVHYHIGDQVVISMDGSLATTKDKIAVTYPGLYEDVQVGGHILFDDGLLDMIIDEKDNQNHELHVTVQNDGVLGSQKGVNAPGVSINLPGITEKDTDDINFGLDHKIDFIAASFVRKAQDILDIRELLKSKHQEHVLIFPKIESQEGIDNFDEIMNVSDGLMIARGDMGVEIPPENVPLIQKDFIRRCNRLGKPVITATQMLDSMQENPRPTRAEASDVANAVFDGTDATMLSGESANGLYPVESVKTMYRIDTKAESNIKVDGKVERYCSNPSPTEAIADSVVNIVNDLGIKVVVVATATGYTARMLSKHRPNADILAITFNEKVQHSLTLNWGVQPILHESLPNNTDDIFSLAKQKALSAGLVKPGDLIIVTAGVPLNKVGATNIIRLVHI